MNRRPVTFRTPAEAEAAHPEIDRAAGLPYADRETFVLYDQTGFAELDRVPCQLERDGSRCNQKHGIGWVVSARPGGVKGYLGGCCRKTHLMDVESLSVQIAEIRDAISERVRRDQLWEFMTDGAFEAQAKALFQRAAALEARGRELRDALPRPVLQRLVDMQKRLAPDLVIEVRYEDRDEHGVVAVEWRSERVGLIAGLAGFGIHRIGVAIEQAQEVIQVLNAAIANPDAPAKDLKKWLKVLEQLPARTRELEVVAANFDAFQRPENVRQLMFLGYATETLDAVVDSIQVLSGLPRLSPLEVRQAGIEWAQSVRTAHGGRRFRVR